MENKLLFDWVSITSRIHSPQNFIQMLGMAKENIVWEKTNGGNGYRDRLYWEGISTHNGEYISKCRKGTERLGLGEAKGEDSVLFGTRSSLILLRIYDKAQERGFKDGRHWIRVELQLKDERALAFIQRTEPIGERWTGVLANYLRFVDEPNGFDTNRWRWPMKDYWARLLDGAAPIRLYEKPGADYNMLNLENFIFVQAGGSIYNIPGVLRHRTIFRGTAQQKKTAEPKACSVTCSIQENVIQ